MVAEVLPATAAKGVAVPPVLLAFGSGICPCGLVGGKGGPAAVAVPVFAAGGPVVDSDAGPFAVAVVPDELDEPDELERGDDLMVALVCCCFAAAL
jgi:hypothetical protein